MACSSPARSSELACRRHRGPSSQVQARHRAELSAKAAETPFAFYCLTSIASTIRLVPLVRLWERREHEVLLRRSLLLGGCRVIDRRARPMSKSRCVTSDHAR